MKKPTLPSTLFSKGSLALKKFPKLKLMVAGDFVVDEAVYGDTERISREAPVLILRYVKTDILPGGAGNAANNAADLGAQVYPLGIVGEDQQGHQLLNYFKTKKMDLSGLVAVKNRPTTVKSRIMAGAHHTAKQQVIRIDRYEDKEISKGIEDKLIARVTTLAPKMDALLISDYGLGVMTEGVRRALLSAFSGKIITVDSRYHLPEYRGVTLITPNVAEAGPAAGVAIQDSESLLRAGEKLQALVQSKVLITRGPQGMALFEKGTVTYLPVHGIDQPVDPTGAGDTVASTVTLALAAGVDLTLAASLATVAAGIVVAKRGTATTNVEEILRVLKK